MTRTPIPNCPQPETPIRDRAWTDGQKSGPQVVCFVCGKPGSVYPPVCAKCAAFELSCGVAVNSNELLGR